MSVLAGCWHGRTRVAGAGVPHDPRLAQVADLIIAVLQEVAILVRVRLVRYVVTVGGADFPRSHALPVDLTEEGFLHYLLNCDALVGIHDQDALEEVARGLVDVPR